LKTYLLQSLLSCITLISPRPATGITFVSDYASLPSAAPPDHPHIIDVAAFTQSHEDKATRLRIQDAVVTMLYNISIGSSDVLGQFLDANKPSFRLVQKYKNLGNTDKFVIARKGDNVLVHILAQLGCNILIDADISALGRSSYRVH
jgi:hypothetical protein